MQVMFQCDDSHPDPNIEPRKLCAECPTLSVQCRISAAFYPERMASRILGMGDVVSFVEKAQKIVDEKEAEEMAKKMMAATFDFDDFLKQSNMVKQMGNMAGTILAILPDRLF